MTNYLESLRLGEQVRIKGAAGPILYHGHGVFTINGIAVKSCKVSMIAGGTRRNRFHNYVTLVF
jgi:hypothetical protein